MRSTEQKTSFNQLIKRDREAAKLTQKQLAANAKAQNLRISQSLLSSWEAGDALPSEDNVRNLAMLVPGADECEWLSALAVAADLQSNMPRSAERVIHQAMNYLDANKDEDFDIWVIGPSNLPVLDNHDIRGTWVDNLIEGRSYHLIWFLDLIDASRLRAALPNFAAIARTAAQRWHSQRTSLSEKDCGTISHYATEALRESSPDCRTVFAQFKNAMPSNGASQLIVHDFHARTTDEHAHNFKLTESVQQLLGFWQRETAIVLYQPKNLLAPAVANLRFMRVCEEVPSSGNSSVEQPMYWLAFDIASEVSTAVARFAAAFEDLGGCENRKDEAGDR